MKQDKQVYFLETTPDPYGLPETVKRIAVHNRIMHGHPLRTIQIETKNINYQESFIADKDQVAEIRDSYPKEHIDNNNIKFGTEARITYYNMRLGDQTVDFIAVSIDYTGTMEAAVPDYSSDVAGIPFEEWNSTQEPNKGRRKLRKQINGECPKGNAKPKGNKLRDGKGPHNQA